MSELQKHSVFSGLDFDDAIERGVNFVFNYNTAGYLRTTIHPTDGKQLIYKFSKALVQVHTELNNGDEHGGIEFQGIEVQQGMDRQTIVISFA